MGPTVGAQKAFGGVKCSRTNTKTSGSFHRTQRGHARSLKKALRLLQSVPKPGWGGDFQEPMTVGSMVLRFHLHPLPCILPDRGLPPPDPSSDPSGLRRVRVSCQ